MAGMSGTLLFTPGKPVVWLREVCALDELAVTDVGTPGAVNLLDRLLTSPPDGSPPAFKATQFTTADRDRLLAVIYRELFGTRIDSTINCISCTERFDVTFQLDELLAFSMPQPGGVSAEPAADGTFRLADGSWFLLPTGADELAILGLSGEQALGQLLQRCLPEGLSAATSERLQNAMEEVAPLLDMDLGAQCPECGMAQSVHFSMQSFLLNRLKNEQKQVVADIHQIATAYRWTHGEIAGLPRRLRRMYVGFIQAERTPADRWLS